MDREHVERECGRISGEDLGRTVALMDIAIQDHHSPDTALRLQRADRHGHIVEHAEPFPVCREGMMGSAGQRHRLPVLQG